MASRLFLIVSTLFLYIGSIQAQYYQKLFNGKDLSGWYTYLQKSGKNHDPLGVFTVDNGILRVSGEEWGGIITNEEFENYRLLLEYKWGDKTYPPRLNNARDGGVLVHSQGSDGGFEGIWMPSIECNIIEGGTGDIIVVGDGTAKFSVTCPVASKKHGMTPVFQLGGNSVMVNKGRINWYGRDADWQDRIGFRGVDDVEYPLGEWNTLEIVAYEASLFYYLNGVLVNRAIRVSPAKGRIQIQSESAEMFFRRIDLVHLPKDYRFIYNSDGSNIYDGIKEYISPEKIYPYVDEAATVGATTFMICPNIGMPMSFPSRVSELIGDNVSRQVASAIHPNSGISKLRDFVAKGGDPVRVVLERAKANGMEGFVSFRLNEVHGVEKEDNILFDEFWRKNPQWRIGKYQESLSQVYYDILGPRTNPVVAGWLPGGLNFAIPEVRSYRLAQLKEICERYDLDGLEIDFQRFPMYFKLGEEASHLSTMTQWMREVKKMVDEVAKKKGKEIKLVARILATPEQNLAVGLNPIQWANEKLLDFFTVSHYLHNNFQLPVETYRQMVPVDFPVYASVEVENSIEDYRQIAYPLWQQSVNGICLFNFFTTREGGKQPPFEKIREIAYPMATGEAILLVANKHSNTLSFVNPYTWEIESTIATGFNPHEIILTPDHRYAYLSNYAAPGNTISVVELIKRQHIKQISTGKFGRIHGTAMAPDGKYAYFTAGQSGYVIEVDVRTQKVTRRIPTDGKISHMVYVSPDGTKLYTANIESEDISVIDRKSGKLLMKIPAGKGVEGMGFTPDARYLWALNLTGGSVMIIDLSTHHVVETFECPGMPQRIRFTPDGKYAVIAHWKQDGEVSVLDIVTRKIIKKMKVGKYAIGIEFSPDGRFAYVGCEDAHRAKQSTGGNEEVEYTVESDGVHVIDLEKLEVVGTIKTGLGPDPMAMWFPPMN